MKFKYFSILMLFTIIYGCGEELNKNPNPIQPIDMSQTTFRLYSENVGIAPDKSVLEDPNNPFKDKPISMDLKWKIAALPASQAVTKFYMWATVLTREEWGEPQFYVGIALKEIYANQGDVRIKEQAIKAFQNVLDNFPYDLTDTTGHSNFASLGAWAYNELVNLGVTPSGWIVQGGHLYKIEPNKP